MKKLSAAALALVLAILSCTGDRTAATVDAAGDVEADAVYVDTLEADTIEQFMENTPMPKAADELFDDFLFNFIANRKLQMERISFPLPVFDSDGERVVERNEWRMERFFMRQGYYTLIFDNEEQMELVKDTAVAHAVVERVLLGNGVVRKYSFDRIGGLWKLCRISEEKLDDNANAPFLRFYERFSVDTTFQVASLHDPVEFVGPDPDDDFGQITGVITPDTWSAFSAELPSGTIYNINYGQTCSDGGSKVFVIRGISNGLEVEMTFLRISGNWKLTRLCT